MTLNDRVLGIAALLLAAFLAWFGHGLEAPFAYEPVGPRAFPLLLAGAIALCGLRLVFKGGHEIDANPPGANRRIALLLALIVAYAALFEFLGFLVATTFFAIGVGRLFGGKWAMCAIGGVAMSVLFYVLFDRVLDVVLPLGVLETVL